MISVLILTKNEEQDLPGCLASVSWCDDVHVFDSFSDDLTVPIAKKAGAKVIQRVFDGYASQRNAALTMPAFKYDWVFILDADERITGKLKREIYDKLPQTPICVNGYRIRRRDFLQHTWLKHAQISPYYIRLIRIGKARYHREVNEVIDVEGKIVDLESYFDHYPFSKGYNHWLNKHNIYSSMEAQRWLEEQNHNFHFSWKKALFSNDFHEKRYHQKGLYYKMPARPVLKWLYIMFWRGALLDGKAGITYSFLQAIYEYFIVIKAKELLAKQKKVRI